MPEPTSFETKTAVRADRRAQPRRFPGDVPLGGHGVGEPEGEAIDEHDARRARLARQGLGERQRLLERGPARPALGSVPGDPRGHLFVARRAGRQVQPLARRRLGERERIAALARARPAQYEQAPAGDRRRSSALPVTPSPQAQHGLGAASGAVANGFWRVAFGARRPLAQC
jgi:hypothetical protein